MLELHKEAISLRKRHPVLRSGSCEFLWNEHGILSFGRWDSNEKVAVILNNNPWPKEINLPVWKMGVYEGHMVCSLSTHGGSVHKDTGDESFRFIVEHGNVRFTVPEYGSMVLIKQPKL